MLFRTLGALALVLLFLTSCDNPTPILPPGVTDTATPTLPPTATAASATLAPTSLPEGAAPVVISEVLAGIQGDNTCEFIELYNRSEKPVDLRGWALWYRLPASREDLFIYRWQQSAIIPPYGHYLLTYAGQNVGKDANDSAGSVGIPADAAYDENALNLNAGGLQLRQTDGKVLDSVGWGEAPVGFFEGLPAPKLTNGTSLERLPGVSAGNGTDTDNNAADFTLSASPNPQNSGSPITPLPAQRLELTISAPESAEPGSSFAYTVTVANLTGQDLHNLTVTLPIPAEFSPETQPVLWAIPALAAAQTTTSQFPVTIPYAYFTAELRNAFVQAEDWPAPAFAAPAITRIEGGSVPIAAARGLSGSSMTIEGVATMYTGGYFAGSGNVKFYLADESAGIQVQVFGGQGVTNVKIGDRVSVRGEVSAYRDSMQIVPFDPATDVIVTGKADAEIEPVAASIADAANFAGADLPGRLVVVEGLVTRVEEFTYSYEIDLSDEAGNLLTLYVDKQTGINVEMIETGQHYRAAGILDARDGKNLLYPRIQADLTEIFPPVLRLTADGPITRQHNVITYTLTAYNHTPGILTNVVITATQPINTSISKVEGGQRQNNLAVWTLSTLPSGESVALTLVVNVVPGYDGPVTLESPTATAAEWPESAAAGVVRTFAGSTVPVWAIQGEGFRSPLIFERIATQGMVTGVFPELGGFFVQDAPDGDPRTSDGVFVSTSGLELDLMAGDSVVVSGTVRELSGQTTLQMATADDLRLVARGQSLPDAVELDPPADMTAARAYYEALEGMFVQVTGPALTVAPTTKFGETVLVRADRGVTRLYQGDETPNGLAIMIDDGSSATYTDRSQMPYAIAAGDTVSAVIGPLAFTYDHYKLEPVVTPAIQPANPQTATFSPATFNQITLMTWNVENLFDTRAPHPSDPPLPTREQYDVSLAKVANTIEAAGAPLIVALQEVENIGVLQDIAGQEVLAAYAYQAVLIEGFDSRGIDVGYLVRTDRAEVLDVQQRAVPEGLTSRPPLIIKVAVQIKTGPVNLYVINNHFTSMSGGEQSTEGVRLAQAQWNLTLLNEILTADPGALVAIVGDLNSYLHAAPIEALRTGGLQHVFDVCGVDEMLCPQERPYTYIYQGESQVLDHILLTPKLAAMLQQVYVLHVNADYPLPNPDDTSPTHKSDHDPVIVVFTAQN
jgi:predicted extracellular nuclease